MSSMREKEMGMEASGKEEGGDLVKGTDSGTGGRSAALLPSNPSQMTIFYAGSVCVFDSISPEKAQAIMLIAAATAAAANTSSPVLTRALSSQSSNAVAVAPGQSQPQSQQQLVPNTVNSLCKLQAELPIARRNSLQRFLEKRRDRLVSKKPYIIDKMPETAGCCLGKEPSTPLNGFEETANSN